MTTLQLEKIEETYLSDIKNASDGKGSISNVIALGSYAKFLYEIKLTTAKLQVLKFSNK